MTISSHILDSIDRQISFNNGKNLFYTGRENHLSFTNRTRELIADRVRLREALLGNDLDSLIEHTVSVVLRNLYHNDQYLDVKEPDQARLRSVYRIMVDELVTERLDANIIARRHYGRLADWLAQTRPELRRMNPPGHPSVRTVVCAEYSPTLQMEVLGLDLREIREPLLDVGCGESAGLVEYLRQQGVDAYGLDRLCTRRTSYLAAKSWFDEEFRPGYWGTLVSNLSFSSHFLNSHLRADGSHVEYATKYMELLHALQVGGSYHYAPSIPFIEQYLPPDTFSVTRTPLTASHCRTIIRRIG